MNNPASHGQSRLFFNAPIDRLLLTLHEEFVIQEIMRLRESEGEPYLAVGTNFSRAEGASITQVPTRIRVLVALRDPRTRQPLGAHRQAAILNVRPLSDTRTVLDAYCMEEGFEPYLNGLLSTLCNVFAGMVEGDIPKEPETEETRQETEPPTTAEAPAAEQVTTGNPKPRRGRKNLSDDQQREIAEFYLENQSNMSYEQVGDRFAVSGKTVQRYVDKFKLS